MRGNEWRGCWVSPYLNPTIEGNGDVSPDPVDDDAAVDITAAHLERENKLTPAGRWLDVIA